MEEILKKLQNKNRYENICRILTIEEQDLFFKYLYELHFIGKSISSLCREYPISHSTVAKEFKKRGYKITNFNNLLSVRQNLFKDIVTEEDAYWLGFIYADGYISDKGFFEISLKLSDKKHLDKFANYIGYLKDVKTDHFRCRINFATQELKDRFNSLGIIPRKSLILKFPKFINKELIKHFIRGYLDGDGCIGLYVDRKTHKFYSVISFIGTKEFLTELIKFLPISMPKISKHGNIYQVNTSYTKAKICIKWLYENCSVFLDRKYSIYQKIAVL